ncbi:acyl-coenzyme A synthetases [alpha proteobacterium U9-1i]|nr:acyl-coenzyme A synthetases [alpha proteobacterium U9-1i]
MSGQVDTFVRDHLPAQDALPDFLFDLPKLRFPARYNASSMLDAAIANGRADKDAVLWAEGRWSYSELLAQANRVAHVLTHDMSLQSGNRVMLHAPNSAMTLAIWWGVLRAGGVAVTSMPMLRATELATLIGKARVSHALVAASLESEFEVARALAGGAPLRVTYFGGGDFDQALRDAPPSFAAVDTSSDDPALIAFTSGTTGQPKGCVHFHRDVAAMAETFSRHIVQPRASDVFCGTPPFAFTFGLGASVVFPAACGAATALPNAPGFEALMDTIARHKVTTLFTAPTGYRAMAKGVDARLASLHTCVSAGEHLPAATSDAWRDATGIRLIDGIGATEMIHIFISARGDDIRPGSTGKPVPGYQACVLGDDGAPLPAGEVGRLAVKGPTGCRYLDDARQEKYVRGGWNITGDLYRMDEDGYFWFVSRADDMIISAGYNIAAPEVENALLQHASVAETAVVGAPDEERGQIVKAFVVLHADIRPNEVLRTELQDHVKRTIAPYKYPRAIEFVHALPKTHTGKLQRFKLKASP